MNAEAPTTVKINKHRFNITPGGEKALKLFEKEIATYARELPRLLAEKEEGRFALIKGDEVLSVWDTYRDANQVRHEKFDQDETSCITRVDARDVERYAILMEQIKELRCQSSNGES